MEQVPFGNTGAMVSRMCLGTMMFGYRCDEGESGRIVASAVERGVTFLDTASMYCEGRTEEILGRVLAGRRDRVFLATKVNVQNGADYSTQVEASLDASLKRLQTDHVDLYLLHWPRKGMDPIAIMRGLGAVVRAGKTRFVGCCNFPAWLLAHFNNTAASLGVSRLVNHQVPYNLIERGVEVEVLPQAAAEGVAVTCYRPLMAGVLSGKYVPGKAFPADARSTDDERITKWVGDHQPGLRKLFEVARGRGVPVAHVAVAWIKDVPGVTCPIIGVSSLKQFEESMGAFALSLTSDEHAALASAFGTEVREVSQYYGPLRRAFGLIGG